MKRASSSQVKTWNSRRPLFPVGHSRDRARRGLHRECRNAYLRARIATPNRDGDLKPDMYLNAAIRAALGGGSQSLNPP